MNKKWTFVFTLSVVTVMLISCSKSTDSKRLLNNDQRVDSLMQLMTVEEKVGQLCQFVSPSHLSDLTDNGGDVSEIEQSDTDANYPGLKTQDILELVKSGKIGSFLHVKTPEEANLLQKYAQQTRLKIPLIIATDAIHGHAMVEFDATIFPSAIGVAATFDTALVRKEAAIIAKEMRATGFHWNFYPNLDIGLDPRWGRIEETFGEDPWLVSLYGRIFTEGLQNGDFNVAACAKHYIAGSRPYNGLNFAPEDISERELRELWLPPFEAAIEAGIKTFMAAHHSLNGIPCHANAYILNTVLKDQLAFDGFVVSDWNDVKRLHTLHKIAETPYDASKLGFNNGIDMHMHGPGFFEDILKAVENGDVPMKRLDDAVKRILKVKYDLGLFENSFVDVNKVDDYLLTDEHKGVALEQARKSIVLMRNAESTLPIDIRKQNVLLTGPAANSPMILGDWAYSWNNENLQTIKKSFEKRMPKGKLMYEESGDIWSISDDVIKRTVLKAKSADVIVVAVGENSYRGWDVERSSGENKARSELVLPGNQEKLILALAELNKPVVVLLVSGRPLILNGFMNKVQSIVNCWIPGIMGGEAIADVVFGNFNPQGKLPVTFPFLRGNSLNYYYEKPGASFRSYVDSPGDASFPFGFGLSYTKFAYDSIKVNKAFSYNEDITLNVYISNVGSLSGTENVLVFMSDLFASVAVPVKKLVAFKSVSLNPGEQKILSVTIPFESLALLDINLNKVVEPGKFKITIPSGDFSSELSSTFAVREN